jgi:hypothetical protein
MRTAILEKNFRRACRLSFVGVVGQAVASAIASS